MCNKMSQVVDNRDSDAADRDFGARSRNRHLRLVLRQTSVPGAAQRIRQALDLILKAATRSEGPLDRHNNCASNDGVGESESTARLRYGGHVPVCKQRFASKEPHDDEYGS